MSEKKPLVSVIMNCHNGEKYLEQSVKSIIDQTYNNWELIFWDNQSTDNSKKIIHKFTDDRIKYFKSENFKKLYVNLFHFLILTICGYKIKLKNRLIF
jgi:glycosyltransferase involved in cell wall biosynthesis